MRGDERVVVLSLCIGVLHVVVLFAGFFSPYDFAQQNRTLPFAPPSRLHFRDVQGTVHWRPSVCLLVERPGMFGIYDEDRQKCSSVRFFVQGPEYNFSGLFKSRWHFFGVAPPVKLCLMGTDGYGRDVFSRLLYGGGVSLLSGLLAMALSLGIGALLGTTAGYYGGWIDAVVMRCGELFLALPWLYLLFALRAFLPLHINPSQAFLLIIAVIGVVGWARPARLIRGIVLSGRERYYVLAARGFGGSDFYVMRRHILPQTQSILLTQAALLVPQYILAEVTLSFLGLGVGEPVPSWGNMLATLQQYHVLVSYWWMWAPGFAVIPVFLSYLLLASALQETAACSAPERRGAPYDFS
jgi:peptide/nickel transport system permease protein